MGKWEMVRLGDIGRFQSGGTPSRENLDFFAGDIPWITTTALNGGGIGFDDASEYITETAIQKSAAKIVPANSIMIGTRVGVGKIGINLVKMSTSQDIVSIINIDEAAWDKKYILRCLQSLSVRFISQSRGATIKGIKMEVVQNALISLPSLDEQKRIAKNLDLASEIVKGYKEQLAELDKLEQSVFYEMFGESKTNPMQWETKKLGEIGKVGSSKRVFTEELVESGIPFYRGTEIGALATKRDINIGYFITQEHYNELCKASGKPAIGDLLMPSICNDGRIWRVNNDEPFYFKDGRVLWVHFSDQSSDNVYIQFALRERLISDYSNIASGTTFAELKIFALKNVDIMLPPLPSQTRFATIVTEIETQKAQVQQALTEAENLFNSLMQEYYE